jgi:hypothetical protein
MSYTLSGQIKLARRCKHKHHSQAALE